MEDSQEDLAFASAMQYSEDGSGSSFFSKSPTDLQQQLLQYKPPVIQIQDSTQISSGTAVLGPVSSDKVVGPMISDPLVAKSSTKISTSIPLFERIQQQKKLQPDVVPLVTSVRSPGNVPTPPPVHAFATKIPSKITDPLTIDERNTILDEYMNTSQKTTEMKMSFLPHDAPVFSSPDHHSFSPTLNATPTYRSTNNHHHPTAESMALYKSQLFNAMNHAGKMAAHTGYHLYHHVSEFIQGHSSSDDSSSISSSLIQKRKMQEMDYQRKSLLRDPHEDNELYDDHTEGGHGNISDSLILDENSMNQRVDIHRKRQVQWQNQQKQLGVEGEEIEEGRGRSWKQVLVQCGKDLVELFMTAPFHIQIGTVGIGILIIWLLFS